MSPVRRIACAEVRSGSQASFVGNAGFVRNAGFHVKAFSGGANGIRPGQDNPPSSGLFNSGANADSGAEARAGLGADNRGKLQDAAIQSCSG